MDVVRQVLLEIEETGGCDIGSVAYAFYFEDQKPAPEEVRIEEVKKYRYELLVDTGWVREKFRTQEAGYGGLSWDAHDFLDAIRQETRWNGLKQYVKQRGEDVSSLPFQTLKSIAVNQLNELITSGDGGA